MATISYTSPSFGQVQGQPTGSAAPSIGLYQCLIVSESAERREMLARSAEQSGWQPIVCGDAPAAFAALGRSFLQLAIVDVAGEADGRLELLAEKAAATQGLLLMVCGNEDEACEELWARQIGAWLYLPGVDNDSDVSMLCHEALTVAQRLKLAPPIPARAARVSQPSLPRRHSAAERN